LSIKLASTRFGRKNQSVTNSTYKLIEIPGIKIKHLC